MEFDISGENIRLEDLKKWCEDRIRSGHTYCELQTDIKYKYNKEQEMIDADVSKAELKSHAV